MPDDTYGVLLDFKTQSEESAKKIRALTDELKEMEEQTKKVGTASPTTLDIRFDQQEVVKEFAGMWSEVQKNAKSAGLSISSELSNAFETGNFSDAALDELSRLEEGFQASMGQLARPADQVTRINKLLENSYISLEATVAETAYDGSLKIGGLSQEVVDQMNKVHELEEAWKGPRREADQARRAAEFEVQKKLGFPEPDPKTFAAFNADELSQDATKMQRAFNIVFKRGEGEKFFTDIRTGMKATEVEMFKFSTSTEEEFERVIRTFGEAKEASEQLKNETLAAAKSASQQGSLFSAQAGILNQQVSMLRHRATEMNKISSQIGQASRLASGVGVGIVGGIFGLAAKYVRDAKEATTVTVAWKAAQESLGKSGQKVGAVLAETALPLLKTAAELAERASSYLEKHPELAQAALNVGIVTAGLGAVGMAVSKGIKMYADHLYMASVPIQLQAAQLQFAASEQQLVAAELRAQAAGAETLAAGGGATAAKGGGLAALLSGGIIATIVTTVVGIAGGLFVGDKLFDAIDKLKNPKSEGWEMRDYLTTLKQAIAIDAKAIGDFFGKNADWNPFKGGQQGGDPELGNKWFKQLSISLGLLKDDADEAADALDGLSGSVKDSPQFEQVLKAYESYKQADTDLVQRHYADRQKVIQDSLQAEARSNAQYTKNVAQINARASADIVSATKNYQEQELKSEQQYAQQRAKIVRDGGIEVQKMEEALQERLRKMAKDHEEREVDLLAARDAVGLVKERQRYNNERAEAVRETNQEMAQRRADLALRLQELAQSYEQERAQRLADYQARLEEIRAQRDAQLKEQADLHRAELAEIRANTVARIKELDTQFNEERRRRYQQFIAQIRDLDASLLGEKALKDKYRALEIADLDRFLAAYRAKLSTITTGLSVGTPKSDGGYAPYGQYLLGDAPGGGRGKKEYVLGGDLTELAERVLGGQLSQSKFAALLSQVGGGGRSNITYNDGRRIDSRISNTDRQKLLDDTLGALASIVS